MYYNIGSLKMFVIERWLARSDHEEHEASTVVHTPARLLRLPHEAGLQMEVLGEAILRVERRVSLLLQ